MLICTCEEDLGVLGSYFWMFDIAYQRLKSSFEDDKSVSEAAIKTQKIKDFLMVKDKYNIFGSCHFQFHAHSQLTCFNFKVY